MLSASEMSTKNIQNKQHKTDIHRSFNTLTLYDPHCHFNSILDIAISLCKFKTHFIHSAMNIRTWDMTIAVIPITYYFMLLVSD